MKYLEWKEFEKTLDIFDKLEIYLDYCITQIGLNQWLNSHRYDSLRDIIIPPDSRGYPKAVTFEEFRSNGTITWPPGEGKVYYDHPRSICGWYIRFKNRIKI